MTTFKRHVYLILLLPVVRLAYGNGDTSFDRQRVGVLLNPFDVGNYPNYPEIQELEDVFELLSKRFWNIYLLCDGESIGVVVQAAANVNSRSPPPRNASQDDTMNANGICLHLRVRMERAVKDIHTVLEVVGRSTGSPSPICGIFFIVSDASKYWEEKGILLQGLKALRNSTSKPLSITAIITEEASIIYFRPREEATVVQLSLSSEEPEDYDEDTARPRFKDTTQMSISGFEIEGDRTLTESFQSLDACRLILTNVSAVGIGGGSIWGSKWDGSSEYGTIHVWSAIYEKYNGESQRFIMGNAFASGWLSGFHNKTTNKTYWLDIEDAACRLRFECGKRKVVWEDWNENYPITTTRVKVTVLASEIKAWKSLYPVSDTNGALPTFYSTSPSALLALRCRSQFPIQWIVHGYMSSMYFISYGPSIIIFDRQNNSHPILYHEASIYLAESANPEHSRIREHQTRITDTAEKGSLFLKCTTHGFPNNSTDYKSLIVLYANRRRYVEDGFFETAVEPEDSFLNEIPCPVSSPHGNISLQRNGDTVDPSAYTFQPYKGFVLNYPVEGNFTCLFDKVSQFYNWQTDVITHHSKKVSIPPEQRFQIYKNILVEPIRTQLYFTQEESLSFSCSLRGAGRPDDLGFQIRSLDQEWSGGPGDNVTTPFLEILNSSGVSSEVDGIRLTLNTDMPRGVYTLSYKIYCINTTSRDNDTSTLWEWSLEGVTTMRLEVDASGKNVYCFYFWTTPAESLNVTTCNSAAHCSFVDRWLRGRDLSGGQIEGVEIHKNLDSVQTQRQVERVSRTDEFGMTVVYHQPVGLVSCSKKTLTEGRRSHRTITTRVFFTTLTGIRVWSWVGLTTSDLVDMVGIGGTGVYVSGDSQVFTCRAVAFHFAVGAILSTTFKNGTVADVLVYPVQLASYGIPTVAHEYAYNLSLALGMVSVTCRAKWWNVTDTFLETTLPLIVQDRLPPHILGGTGYNDTEGGNNDVVLTAGLYGYLNCTAETENRPSTTFTWEKVEKGKKVRAMNNTVIKGEQNESIILQFEKVQHEDAGLYRCRAINSIGHDERDFSITVKDGATSTLFVSIFFTLFLVSAGLLGYVGFKYYKTQKRLRGLTPAEREEFFAGDEPYDMDFEVAEETLSKDGIIGMGEFGVVYKGTSTQFPGLELAIKCTKPSGDKEIFTAMLQEVKLMIRVGNHSNIVTFHGAVTDKIDDGIVYVLLSYCSNGDLCSSLRKMGTSADSEEERQEVLHKLCQWATEIAVGMEYIHTKKIVHGDLASRNVLLDDSNTVKISDFGLAKQLYNNTAYRRRRKIPLPWRWMSPEGLSTFELSPASDVWSYGITLWEMFSLGKVPYASGEWNAEHERDLSLGKRLAQPPHASTEIYAQMMECWNYTPDDRPRFDTLKCYFSRHHAGLIYVEKHED